ncbi:DUF3817 domain-containing protein [Corynebacterium alimapuense]|uniref:DUF3817 domain-containing protein n=1 Tax=Corynebacterium alimapuense TaxID=1576874 RepID=A0A3M8K951_9CORY|nr:DUF3817 domain-containing protein [Corynebacterium alimapuense]RNE49690.1 DUF3817 domain-containing protein [Corynebacterium alimapuense]
MTTQAAPKIHPERQRRVKNALRIFSVTAWVTGVFLLILVVRMVLEYVLKVEIPEWATVVAILHGWAFMAYLLATLNLGLKARWKPIVWFTTAISGVVPFLSFIVEANRRREVTAEFQLD